MSIEQIEQDLACLRLLGGQALEDIRHGVIATLACLMRIPRVWRAMDGHITDLQAEDVVS